MNFHERIERQAELQFVTFLPQVVAASGIRVDVFHSKEETNVVDDLYGQYSGQKLYNDEPDFQILAVGLPIHGFRNTPFDSYLRSGHFGGSESVFVVCNDALKEGDVLQVCGSTERLIITDLKSLGRHGLIFQLTVANIMSGEQTHKQTSPLLKITG